MKERVVVAMSGGVDSSVAAALLKKQGYEVIGITMCFNLADSAAKAPICCSLQGREDARRVADKLGLRHYSLNMQGLLQEKVVKNFCQEYIKGRTPNPCVRCNQYLKFGALLKKALSLEARFLATGHYARIVRGKQGCQLRKARDLLKDQSYFLYRMSQAQLKQALFPLGDYTKLQVRRMAQDFGLGVANKLASQEICFLSGSDYRQLLMRYAKPEPGPVVDKEGKALGEHKGIAYYTIGQREGLGIAMGYPVYVIGIDVKKNLITVGRKEDAYMGEFLVGETHFIRRPIKKKVALKVKIRYNHQEESADILPVTNGLKIKFKEPQFAVTPGQSAVFYDRGEVVGGGIIEKALS